MSTIIFETERLIVAKIDLQNSLEIDKLLNIHNDHETMMWIPNKKKTYNKNSLEIKYSINKGLYNISYGIYKILFKKTNEVIGEFGLFPYIEKPTSVEIGYIIDRRYWKKGLGTELVKNCETYIKETLHKQFIIAQLIEQNIASHQLLRNLSYQLIAKTTIDKLIVRLTLQKEL
ncbi:GNAT family N-acetyltransferase [Myroides pelagicus]|uniref:GNAT family N-acetyltransferase n=1 Tax=Myroides pelagicus TaxID=270914 RepID=A0A7K1GNH3_9FLAO|nr:GNAT family protein [Myroides pelagicus]MEC4114366.1 GNAT family protein [Myroides pelagicus]MTH30089.1 GNAT family N-acetyltransferase [Myroides pelagicus]